MKWIEHSEQGRIETSGKNVFQGFLTAWAGYGYQSDLLPLIVSFNAVSTAADAIRASFSMNSNLKLFMPGSYYGYTAKPEGHYKVFIKRHAQTQRDHYIIALDSLEQNKVGDTELYIPIPIGATETETMNIVMSRVASVFPITLFPEWRPLMWDYGTKHTRQILPVSYCKGVTVYRAYITSDWVRHLQEARRTDIIPSLSEIRARLTEGV